MVIIAVSAFLLCTKVILKKNGKFPSVHIHDSAVMHKRGIHCVLDQDREARQPNRCAVREK